MQNSSAFQFLAIDQIRESTTNPRTTFDPTKLEELAESIRQHGVIQPITVRPNGQGFEIVAGARRYRAAQLAEEFSIPARIVELDDAAAMEWQLVENSQRVDVHPYEEAQGFQRLLELPGYDVAALAAKSGKSISHIYGRLSLLQLIPEVAQAFVEERITASHANLIARIPQEHQATAFEQSWRKDWQDVEPHLLPAKHLSAWIETNLYLALADAPFDREDITLNVEARACITCPKRSGYNTSLFADVQGDQCLDAGCYQAKVAAHIDHALQTQPHLVQIETAWRPAKEQRAGVLQKNTYRVLDITDNPDADPPCPNTRTALIVFGRGAGNSVSVCVEGQCPVHNPTIAARIGREEAEQPTHDSEPTPEDQIEEEPQAREAENEQEQAEYQAEQDRRAAERKAVREREEKEYEAEVKRREEQNQARLATLENIVQHAPAALDAAQLRMFIELLLSLSPYGFFEGATEYFAGSDENQNKTDDEILSGALAGCTDDKLTGFVLRLLLTEHISIPREDQPDWLTKAEAVFGPPPSKPAKANSKSKTTATKSSRKKNATTKKIAA